MERQHLIPSDDYKEITSRMLAAIPPNTPKMVRDKLKTTLLYANEPSLRQRLKRLYDELADEFGEMPLRMKRNDVNRLVDTRNYLTHYPEELKASAVPADELPAKAHQLTLLTIVLILRRLGFSADNIQRALYFNSNFRMFAPPNPALAKK
jgi:hypothetical protein